MPNPTPRAAPAGATTRRKARPRGRGRPATGRIEVGGEGMSRSLLLTRALELSREVLLHEMSMAVLAQDLGVTPALIYYDLTDRDTLVSGVVNLFFQAMGARWEPLTGDWQADMTAFARAAYDVNCTYVGVAAYLAQHNRFRLFQKVGDGETDHGLAYFDRAATILQSGGFTAGQAALAYHLIMQHVVASGGARVRHMLPADHQAYLRSRLQATPAEQFPGAHFLADAFPGVSADQSFEAGLELTLDGVARWLPSTVGRARMAI
jgi:AcrR family transcriptional regulator